MIDRKKTISLVVAGILALAAAGDVTSPRKLFEERLQATQRFTKTFDSLVETSSVRAVEAHLGWLQRDGGPDQAALLESFSPLGNLSRVSDLPLSWNAEENRFEVLEQPLAVASDAVVHFTWSFLRAYGSLDATLRVSRSTLAVGLAAIVAAEVTHPTNWAYLPADLHEPAAIVSLFLVDSPELVDAGRRPAAERSRLVEQALRDTCVRLPVEAREFAVRLTEAPSALSWRPSSGDDGPPRWTELQPRGDACTRQLGRLADRIPNTTLRALVLAILAPELPDPFEEANDAFRQAWSRELRRLLDDLQTELTIRELTGLAPRPQPDAESTLSADPTVLRPLLAATGHFALADSKPQLDELRDELSGLAAGNRDEVVRRMEAVILKALRAHAVTSTILDLAGAEPKLEVPGRLDDSSRAYLTWSHSVRRLPGLQERWESVRVPLVGYKPSDTGMPSDVEERDGEEGGNDAEDTVAPASGSQADSGQRGRGKGEGGEGEGKGKVGKGKGKVGKGEGEKGKGKVGPGKRKKDKKNKVKKGKKSRAKKGKKSRGGKGKDKTSRKGRKTGKGGGGGGGSSRGSTQSGHRAGQSSFAISSVPEGERPDHRGRVAPRDRKNDLHLEENVAPKIPRLTPEPRTDPIALPDDARRELERRAVDILARFRQEAAVLRPPEKRTPWLRHLESQLGGPSPWLTPPALRLDELLAARRLFLDAEGGPFASELGALAIREIVLASWLWEAGARSTAELLLSDLVELAVFAGCEARRGVERLDRSPDLHLLLRLPFLVYGMDAPKTIVLSPPALRVARAWTLEIDTEDVVEGTAVDLEKLHDLWEWKGRRMPFWLPMPRLRRNGQWASDSYTSPGAAVARRLDRWLRRTAGALPRTATDGEEP